MGRDLTVIDVPNHPKHTARLQHPMNLPQRRVRSKPAPLATNVSSAYE